MLDLSTGDHHDNHPTQLGLVCKTAEGAFLSLVQAFRTPLPRGERTQSWIYGLDTFWHFFFWFHIPSSAKAVLGSPCCSLAPRHSFPPFPLPGSADTSVWARVADRSGGRMWDTCSHHRYFCPGYDFLAVKQSFLRQL